jgi:hypothetical protein
MQKLKPADDFCKQWLCNRISLVAKLQTTEELNRISSGERRNLINGEAV